MLLSSPLLSYFGKNGKFRVSGVDVVVDGDLSLIDSDEYYRNARNIYNQMKLKVDFMAEVKPRVVSENDENTSEVDEMNKDTDDGVVAEKDEVLEDANKALDDLEYQLDLLGGLDDLDLDL
jgi:hypothetical protein